MIVVEERWAPVRGFEGAYEVSDLGRVRSLSRMVTERRRGGHVGKFFREGRILRPGLSGNGYLSVAIGGKSYLVQHLVAAAFLGPKPPGCWVLHGDGVRTHNIVTNLRYGTPTENCADTALHGMQVIGSDFPTAKLHEWTASVVRALRGYWTQAELAMLFEVSASAIQAVHDGRTWRHSPTITLADALEWFWSYGPGAGDPISIGPA